MNRLRKRPILRKTVATGSLTFGVISLILPILPGWLFIGFAMYLFLLDEPHLQEKLARLRLKHGWLDNILKKTYDRVHKEKSAEEALKSVTSV